MIVWVAAAVLVAGMGPGADCGSDKERRAQSGTAAVEEAYSRARAQFTARLDEVGLVGSTLARGSAIPGDGGPALEGRAAARREPPRTPRRTSTRPAARAAAARTAN